MKDEELDAIVKSMADSLKAIADTLAVLVELVVEEKDK